MKKKKLQENCQHEWRKSYEECVIFDEGAGEHTGMHPKWTCQKCGKILWVNLHT